MNTWDKIKKSLKDFDTALINAYPSSEDVKGSSLVCPKCGSIDVNTVDLTVLEPVLRCRVCGEEWMPEPGYLGEGLAGAHQRKIIEKNVRMHRRKRTMVR